MNTNLESPKALHEQALELLDKALIAKKQGLTLQSQELRKQALDFEIKAAEALPSCKDNEPTRSILYRGAASLAYQVGEYSLALQLIQQGRTEYAPDDILEDLNALEADILKTM